MLCNFTEKAEHFLLWKKIKKSLKKLLHFLKECGIINNVVMKTTE